MALPNPVTITTPVRLRPKPPRFHSRSPSRSPARKTHFTAQHLDPLLSNLSPDSTLRALQTTQTISSGDSQDALTQSIVDASPSEREIGIRAAFAAQNLREWLKEITKWTWPGRQGRALGAGFLPPRDADFIQQDGRTVVYVGCLPLAIVDEYEQRIDDIRDALESLDIDEIKEHVLEAHAPESVPSDGLVQSARRLGHRQSYGRLRDFTALVTATVIQALPDLANLTTLLETWQMRINVLRQLPMVLDVFATTKAGVNVARSIIRDLSQAPLITQQDFDSTRAMLGEKVSDLGSRIDKLLDLLEGREDSLPQVWIDDLERIERDYAAWVIDAQHIAMKNELERSKVPEVTVVPPKLSMPSVSSVQQHVSQPKTDRPLRISSFDQNRPLQNPAQGSITVNTGNTAVPDTSQKPMLSLNLPRQSAHSRHISEISVADSTLSNISDLSNAEIVDARSTVVLASPKISLIDNPFRSSQDLMSRFGANTTHRFPGGRPPLMQRASTTVVEILPKLNKASNLSRSISNDLPIHHRQASESTPQKALRQLTGADDDDPRLMDRLSKSTMTGSTQTIPSSVMVQTLPWMTEEPKQSSVRSDAVELPTKTNKLTSRRSLDSGSLINRVRFAPTVLPQPPKGTNRATDASRRQSSDMSKTTRKPAVAVAESLESKIEGILTTLPTRIRLAKEGDSTESTSKSSVASTGSSTPTQELTLSPVKSSRRSSGDTDIKLFHLTQNGQSRDAPPIKLFVRTVGENGERVMVRVGGGWADLGEYLKEYSMHHGGRGGGDGHLEVAQYPGDDNKDQAGQVSVPPMLSSRTTAGLNKRRKAKSISDMDAIMRLKNQDNKDLSRFHSPEPPRMDFKDRSLWMPPPVPPIPAAYSSQSSATDAGPHQNTGADTTIIDHDRLQILIEPVDKRALRVTSSPRSSTFHVSSASTATILNPENTSHAKYTPLGAAGPKSNIRRSVTYGAAPPAVNEAWVQGMVGKARAVSSSVAQTPTNVGTIGTISTSSMPMPPPVISPVHRRSTSTFSFGPTNPVAKSISAAPVNTLQKNPPPNSSGPIGSTPKNTGSITRHKSRLSLADVSGIKRVFLRKKSDKFSDV